MTAPTAATRLIALLGDPVTHSLSPVFQNAAFAAAGVDGVYLALRCAGGEVPALMRAIAHAGGAGNVTVPHKARAAECLDHATPAVARTGACNCFWLEGGALHGDNTDVEGFAAAATAVLDRPLRGVRAMVLGAGGAASAALAALADAEAAEVTVRARRPESADALASRFTGVRVERWDAGPPLGQDLVVNATPLGLGSDDPLPMRPADIPAGAAALDLVYAPGGTAWVRALRAAGVPAADGREMLLHQGAAAFRNWWRRPAPLDVMRSALEAALDP